MIDLTKVTPEDKEAILYLQHVILRWDSWQTHHPRLTSAIIQILDLLESYIN